MTLRETIAALEAADGPNYDLDALIWNELGRPDTRTFDGTPCVLTYTASLDAALTLVPEGQSWMVAHSHTDDRKRPGAVVCPANCSYATEDFALNGEFAATAPLALCIAALKAQAKDVT